MKLKGQKQAAVAVAYGLSKQTVNSIYVCYCFAASWRSNDDDDDDNDWRCISSVCS